MTESKPFTFAVGQIVHHRRYGYRGVIFERDAQSQADAAWHQKNQTQPPREDPWYHVMVDGAAHTTYVWQGNLEPDPGGAPINHPMLSQFFTSYRPGRYEEQNLN